MDEGDSTAKVGTKWQAISARDRRVLGALVEKAKTTPDQYPLSLNATRAACNQKSNRFPTMELDDEQVQESLDRLRSLGAASVVQGGSRVERFRHLAYEWLGVDKVEMAVMAELLLRGAQTEGELRGRASRMEAISDLSALRTILDRLKSRNLIVSLTREGRGHVLSHNLYRPEELERLKGQYAGAGGDQASPAPEEPEESSAVVVASPRTGASLVGRAAEGGMESRELDEVKAQVAELRATVDELSANLSACQDEVRQLREALGA
ncbi:MAG: YceH family protein [Pirellulales bacterium]|nr:YceH family protein [Pirellulales bacterium]